MGKLRIVIADDHELVRRGLRSILEGEAGWEVVAEASNGREAVRKVEELRPDVVVIDLSMPELNGLTATRQILQSNPKTEIVLLTMHDAEQTIIEVLQTGARGYVLKSDAGRDLVTAVRTVSNHTPYFTPHVADFVLKGYLNGQGPAQSNSHRVQLTSREREIVQLLAEGKTSKEVATSLFISTKTAEAHRVNINRKLGLHSVSELVRYAIRNGIVTP
jgi:DNA-binding NarL/FixJ family response regulator